MLQGFSKVFFSVNRYTGKISEGFLYSETHISDYRETSSGQGLPNHKTQLPSDLCKTVYYDVTLLIEGYVILDLCPCPNTSRASQEDQDRYV